MAIIIILSVIFMLGLAFGGKEKPSNLPPFTKEEAERYYYTEIKGEKNNGRV
jgi:hypothetical protein